MEGECAELAGIVFLLETPNLLNPWLTWIRNVRSVSLAALDYPLCSQGNAW